MMVQKKFSEDEKSEEEKSKTYDAKIYQESDSSSFKCDKKSLLQSFQLLLLSVSGRHELRNLNQLESAGPRLQLGGNQLFSAMYINEVHNRLLPK
mgnify:CR=1 FL=1